MILFNEFEKAFLLHHKMIEMSDKEKLELLKSLVVSLAKNKEWMNKLADFCLGVVNDGKAVK